MIHFKPFKFGKAEWGVIMIFLILVLLALGIMTVPFVATQYARLTSAWTEVAIRWGYLGAFLSALIGSMSVIIIFPYTIIIFFLATQGLDPFWLGAMMGVGAAIGQMSGWVIGTFGTGWFRRKKPETYDALENILHFRPWLITWLLVLFGMTPLPDDLLMIPLGMLRYPFWKTFLPAFIGKILAGFFVTYSSSFLAHSFDAASAAPATAIVSQFGTLAAIAILLYIFWRLDWTKMMHRLLDRHVNEVSPTDPPRR